MLIFRFQFMCLVDNKSSLIKQVQSNEDLPEEVSSSEDVSGIAENKQRVPSPTSEDTPDYASQRTPTKSADLDSPLSKLTYENENENVVKDSAWMQFSPGESLSVECSK